MDVRQSRLFGTDGRLVRRRQRRFVARGVEGQDADDFDDVVEVDVVGRVVNFGNDGSRIRGQQLIVRFGLFRFREAVGVGNVFLLFATLGVVNDVVDVHLSVVDKASFRRDVRTGNRVPATKLLKHIYNELRDRIIRQKIKEVSQVATDV